MTTRIRKPVLWKVFSLSLLLPIGAVLTPASDAASTTPALKKSSPILAKRIESLLQRARGDADPRVFSQVEPLLREFELSAPNTAQPKVLRAWYDMSLHRFSEALASLREAHRLGGEDAISLGLMSDALVELGQYDDAVSVTQRMLDRYPGLSAMTRAAHLRFLHGDLEGAIELNRAALEDPKADASSKAWVHVQLAQLHLHDGKVEESEREVEIARPHASLPALAMLGKLRARQGRTGEAQRIYLDALQRQPNPEFAFAAFELARDSGNDTLLRKQRNMLEAMSRLDRGGLYRRLFAAFYSELPARRGEALTLAQQEFDARPDIYSHMVLGWVLYRNGDIGSAAEHAKAATRLNTPDPTLRAQAAEILRAAAAAKTAKDGHASHEGSPVPLEYERWHREAVLSLGNQNARP